MDLGEATKKFPPCAACKHQKRKCDESCLLAKYFPVERIEDFENVQRLFGVNNVRNMLKSVEEHERDKTAESMISEARIRRENPVHGSIEVMNNLNAVTIQKENELEDFKKQLEEVKKIEHANQVGTSSTKQFDGAFGRK
ncbi:hypothetical protein ACJIZ3_018794 [Penstemon smallii]|uniref:LOB domain-containing protein n=1 Tax=Penstemon smallii TaxID=265156 RepID=A0ABD3SZF3_9LAMI